MADGVNHDDKTGERHYPLPHPDNTMEADVHRMRDALHAVDADMVAQAAEMRRQRVRSFLGFKL